MKCWVIARRELRGIFTTTTGWLVLGGFWMLAGFFWSSMVSFYLLQSAELVSNPYTQAEIRLSEHLLSPFFGNLSVILLMIMPALTMRLFAEERKQGTLELLFSSPISTTDIVAGKAIAVFFFLLVMLAGTLYAPLTLWTWGQLDIGLLACGYLGVFLMAAAVSSMGMLCSALTENQVVALILAFSASLAMWVLAWISEDPTHILVQIAMVTHAEELLRGVLRGSDLTYFVLFNAVALTATHQRLETLRWR